ncbi:hypothetical protein FHG87_014961 [Trinorchestia longiramus]|nr:hypothetical protein FHG87_014961 [Trinorchestia longiramus]
MKVIWFTLCLVAASFWETEGLTCFPCYETVCEDPVGCKWGTQSGVCGCCTVCRPVGVQCAEVVCRPVGVQCAEVVCRPGKGEQCGGPWNVYGECGEGLACLQSGPYGDSYCADEGDNEIERTKRSLASRRRVGLARIQPKVHRHQEFGGVPEHIKRLLRAQGVVI